MTEWEPIKLMLFIFTLKSFVELFVKLAFGFHSKDLSICGALFSTAALSPGLTQVEKGDNYKLYYCQSHAYGSQSIKIGRDHDLLACRKLKYVCKLHHF